jgi:toxin-antitoxin system PIN domain toxin
MRCVDVNVLVYAHRPESPEHEVVRRWLDEARTAAEPLGLAPGAVHGFLRVVTHPKVFVRPTPVDVALAFVDALRTSPAALDVQPGPRHWELVRQLCLEVGATGNVVPDAVFAAIAIEHGATWVSCDRGFAKFRSLRWMHPADAMC